jgi:sensor histidine kinase YesM
MTPTLRSRDAAYWSVQAAGWGAYSAIGLWAAAQQIGWQPALVVGYAAYFAYSILLTDALRREARRRGWLDGPAAPAWGRMLAAGAGIGVIQTILIVAINLAFEGRASVFTDWHQVFFVWLGTTLATSLWVVYYLSFTAKRRRRDQEARLQLALRNAELGALEAQINPHFLFNALNSIRGLVVENPPRAQDMITRLSNILRYNLRHDVRHTAPLADEVDIVADYLALETVRFEERLRVRMAIATGAGRVPVPSMLLQTLVENAVKHGIAPLASGGDLVIRADVDGARLIVDIENTGQLANAERGATQVGLSNARERLRILYGDTARLDVVNRDDRHVAATLRIPITA